MKNLRKSFFITFVIILSIPFKGFSQEIKSNDSLNSYLIQAAREIMTSAGTCTLITLDQEGRPRARVMDPFLPESDLTVWFGTNSKSRKVQQIENDPRVTLYYFDKDASAYVMMSGKAQLVDDLIEKEVRWKNEWEAFYPNKQKEYLLIKVTPDWIEVLSYSRGILGDPVTWEPPKVIFDLK